VGTEVRGSGASVRRASNGTSGGSTSWTTVWTGASEIERLNVDAVGADSSVSDAAQQRSASAWLTVWTSPCSPALCIGQSPSSEQHAIRASAVGIQPAQSARLLDASARVRRSADTRRLRSSTILGCANGGRVSNKALGARAPTPGADTRRPPQADLSHPLVDR
jgi:hypothetical protein